MRTPRYLPKVHNGAVAKRQSRSNKSSTSKSYRSRASIARPSLKAGRDTYTRRVTEGATGKERGSRVMWLMILMGAALATGFIFALRSQNNTYKIAQAEEELKSQLDKYSIRQKFLSLDQEIALNPSATDRAGKWNGLVYLKLDKDSAHGKTETKPPAGSSHVDQNKVSSPTSSPEATKGENETGNKSGNGDINNKRRNKLLNPKAAKANRPGKNANMVKVVKLNSSKSSSVANGTKADLARVKKRA